MQLEDMIRAWMPLQLSIISADQRLQALEVSLGQPAGNLGQFQPTPASLEGIALNINDVEIALTNLENRRSALGF